MGETAKVTSKGQITIPKAIRDRLRVRAGDLIVFDAKGDDVVVKKVPLVDAEWARAVGATLTEWEDDLDDEL